MSFTPTMPSDFLHLVTMLCRHLPERPVSATIDWHLYGPAWTGGVTDLEDQLLRRWSPLETAPAAKVLVTGLPAPLQTGRSALVRWNSVANSVASSARSGFGRLHPGSGDSHRPPLLPRGRLASMSPSTIPTPHSGPARHAGEDAQSRTSRRRRGVTRI